MERSWDSVACRPRDPDYQNIKIGRQFMGHVEKNDLLLDEIHGCRSGRTVHDAVMEQQLLFDIA